MWVGGGDGDGDTICVSMQIVLCCLLHIPVTAVAAKIMGRGGGREMKALL